MLPLAFPLCGAAEEAALIAKGRQIVEAKRCAVCHEVNGKGGTSLHKGKPLNGITEGHNDEFLKLSLLDPKKVLGTQTRMPAYKFSSEEVRAVLAYMKSLPPEAR